MTEDGIFNGALVKLQHCQKRQSYEAVPVLNFQTSDLSQQLRKSAFYRRRSLLCTRSADGHNL